MAMSDIDNDNFEGTTRDEQRWVVRGESPSEVCQRVAACLSTSSAGSLVKVRKGSRVIYGLLGASFTPRALLPVKLWISVSSADAGFVTVSVIAKSGAAERGIDGLLRGPKRFQAAFDLWLTKIRQVAPPEESS
jgi:hypothetical protein